MKKLFTYCVGYRPFIDQVTLIRRQDEQHNSGNLIDQVPLSPADYPGVKVNVIGIVGSTA